MSEAVSTVVEYFEGIIPTVQDNQARQKDDDAKTARMIAEQLARNKAEADQRLRQGVDLGMEDVDWQTRH
jgi:hypothetical protein